MSFFKKLFGKNEPEEKNEIETDGKTYIKNEPGSYIINKDAQPKYTYKGLDELQYGEITFCLNTLKHNIAPACDFTAQPFHHPQNLDNYLTRWFQAGFGKFLGIDADQHAAFLAYSFGQYLVEVYNMEWKIKSDERGGKQTVVRMTSPAEIELYPIDSTLRAIKNKDMTLYVAIDEKMKRALEQFKK
ncbi:MAG: hypothetical protein ABIP51_22905 [Bacteroidia bacterium]